MSLKPAAGVDALDAPRRTLLDRLLVDAARGAGASIRFGTTVKAVLRDGDGGVTGVSGRDSGGREFVARAPLTIGADGLNSFVAGQVDAPFERVGRHASVCVDAYWPGLEVDGYEWFWRAGTMVGLIPPTGTRCACASPCRSDGCAAPLPRAARLGRTGSRGAIGDSVHTDSTVPISGGGRVRAPGLGARLGARRRRGLLQGSPERPGITDALRDAELLARVVVDGAVTEYQRERDRLSHHLFGIVDELAAFDWDAERVRNLLLSLSASMTDEVEALGALDREPVRGQRGESFLDAETAVVQA